MPSAIVATFPLAAAEEYQQNIPQDDHSEQKSDKKVCEGKAMKKTILDKEEKDILEAYDRGEWESVKDPKKEFGILQAYARNTLRKDKRINIRMSSKDLDQVQAIAAQEGIPYQTLVSSIIHKYVSGYLVERKKAQ